MRTRVAALAAGAAVASFAIGQTAPFIATNAASELVSGALTSLPDGGASTANTVAYRFVAPSTGSVQSAAIFTGSPRRADSMRLEIWDHDAAAGVPNRRLAAGTLFSPLSARPTWLGTQFDTRVAISAGASYWFVWVEPGDSITPEEPGGVQLDKRVRASATQWEVQTAGALKMRLHAGPLPMLGVTSFGGGCPASSGAAPAAFVNRPPSIGEDDFAVEATNLPPGQQALLLIGFEETFSGFPLEAVGAPPGCGLWSDPFVSVVVRVGTAEIGAGTAFGGRWPVGHALVPMPISPHAALTGAFVSFQFLAVDPGSSAPFPVVTTNALRCVVPGAPIRFLDVSDAAGIADVGLSWGASAGDYDGDGWVDVFTTGHYRDHPRLWHNRGDGTFADVAPSVLTPVPDGDLHGAQFVDLHNDGSPELVVLRGGSFGVGVGAPNIVYDRGAGTLFSDVAALLGLSAGPMRARTPLSLDYDDDGLLDLWLTARLRADGTQPPSLFRGRSPGPFGPVFSLLHDTEFATAGDLDGDGAMDVLFQGDPLKAFGWTGGAIAEITASLGLPPLRGWLVQDLVIADFTGDGKNDVFCALGRERSGFHVETDGFTHRIEWRATVRGEEHALRFASSPDATIALHGVPWVVPWSEVHIGATGWSPTGDLRRQVALSPLDPSTHGMAPHRPGIDDGVYIGWDASAGEWVAAVSRSGSVSAMFEFTSASPFGVPEPVGFDPDDFSDVGDLLLIREATGYRVSAAFSALRAPADSLSAVAADFDNDRDLDLYVVQARPTGNPPNTMYENLGGGTFRVAARSGTAGTARGIGDSVVTLDYDRDGRVDLFTVNGSWSSFYQSAPRAFSEDGPAQLLRNVTTNDNHWLRVDLRGRVSNRSGIGARIEVTAGGVTQVREHSGGIHRYSQNDGIHFGLGSAAVADRVEVLWPSGQRTVMTSVAGDREIVIAE